MALEDLSGQLQGKFGGNPGNTILGTNAGTFQRFSLPAVIVNEIRKSVLTLDNLGNINGPQRDTFANSDNAFDDGGNIVDLRDRTPVTSVLGTTVMDYLEFPGGLYPAIDDPTELKGYPGIRIDEVLFTVSREKQIIETMTVGGQRSIKEYIAAGDYKINAQCVIIGRTDDNGESQGDFTIGGLNDARNNDINNNSSRGSGTNVYTKESVGNSFPYRDMKMVHEMLSAPAAIKLNSRLLNDIFGIYNVVVLDYEFTQERGANNYQILNINMVSDESPEKQDKDETINEGN